MKTKTVYRKVTVYIRADIDYETEEELRTNLDCLERGIQQDIREMYSGYVEYEYEAGEVEEIDKSDIPDDIYS